MNRDFYSTKEVGELTGYAEVTIRSYIYRGQIKATKFGGCYMITKEDFEQWLKVHKEKPGNRRKAGGKNE